MPTSSKVSLTVLSVLVLCLVLAGCTAGSIVLPFEGTPVATIAAIARSTADNVPSAPVSQAPTEAPSATPLPTATPQPTLTPTPSMTPTVVQGVKDTSVLVNAQLVRVIDGNTIEVSIKGKNYQVRYLGVAAPAADATPEPYAAQAAAGNKKLVSGQALRLETDVSDTDADGRLLRYVYTKTIMINAEMVRLGYARAQVQAPDTRYMDLFATMENEARAARRGLWALAPTQTPAAPAAGTALATPAR